MNPNKARSERSYYLGLLFDKVNVARKGKPLSIGFLAKKLHSVPTADVKWLYHYCEGREREGQPFSKVFFGRLKVDNDT